MNKEKVLLDASFLVSLIVTADNNHWRCVSFFENNKDRYIFYIPALAYFEFQATQSRNGREYRDIFIPNLKLYNVGIKTMRISREKQLFDKFKKLKGADLVYACIAYIEGFKFVTSDKHFLSVKNYIDIIFLDNQNS